MFVHETQVRVRYAETDQMGFAYYGNYAKYYEIGRVEALRSLGLSYRAMEAEHGILMPVVSMQMRFVRPVHYDELLTIKTALRALPSDYITFHTRILNEQGKTANGGRIRLCFLAAQ